MEQQLNLISTSLSDGSPPVAVDGWLKVVNKQGQPVTRKSGDATLRRCADADDIMFMYTWWQPLTSTRYLCRGSLLKT